MDKPCAKCGRTGTYDLYSVCKECWQEAKIKQLEEALLYYANYEGNMGEWGEYGNLVGTADGDVWEEDEGKIAQKALEDKCG